MRTRTGFPWGSTGVSSGRRGWPSSWPLQPLPKSRWIDQRPTHRDARPGLIEAAMRRAQTRPSGNWFVLAASDAIRRHRPFGTVIAGTELVAWRDTRHRLRVGPGACPHLGAPLADAAVDRGALVCAWHGRRLGAEGCPDWRLFPSYDDGVLAWVRLDEAGGEPPLPAPVVPDRPPAHSSVTAVIELVGRCEPADVVANRLDPWHGGWFHPYAFTDLRVLSTFGDGTVADRDDVLLVAVTFRVTSRLGVPVVAAFSCPEPRTVVMRIVDGEGAGSVVETHATPLGAGPDGHPRTALREATIACSDRPGFAVARAAAPGIRWLIRRAATRLWRDDIAYAERRYQLRTTGSRAASGDGPHAPAGIDGPVPHRFGRRSVWTAR